MAALYGTVMPCRTRSASTRLPSMRFSGRLRPAGHHERRRRAAGEILDGDGLKGHLQAICERVLGVSPIGWSDNLLGFGVDLLAVVNLLLEIEGYVGHPSPLRPAVGAVDRRRCHGRASAGGDGGQQAVRSGRIFVPWSGRPEPVCRFLEEILREIGINAATWRRLSTMAGPITIAASCSSTATQSLASLALSPPGGR